MSWLLLLAAQTRRWASHTAGAHWCRSPLWMALAFLLVACGQAVAAAPLEPATFAPVVPATTSLAASASATPPLDNSATHQAVTPVPSNQPQTATVAASQAKFAAQAGPSTLAPLAPTATPSAQIK